MSQRPSLKMEGTLATDGKSLREALRWASRQPLPGGGFGPLRPQGADRARPAATIMLSGVNIELDGNVAEGVLALATEPRVTVKGTLAADALDLTPYMSHDRGAALERARLEPRHDSRSTGLRTSISTCASRRRA